MVIYDSINKEYADIGRDNFSGAVTLLQLLYSPICAGFEAEIRHLIELELELSKVEAEITLAAGKSYLDILKPNKLKVVK